jgi:DNA-binding transcriptional LysR family regulator
MTKTRSLATKDGAVTAISDLDIFARVARTGNMSAAGREMGLSPAVVSKRISMLEDRLGARLFQRTTRHLTLTETGEGYFKRVLDILSLVEEAEDFVSRRNTRPRGNLKITVPTAFGAKHVAPHLAGFIEQYPEIELDFHVTDLSVDIIRDGFDVALRIGELQDSSLVARKLAPDHRILCAAPSYIESAGTPKSLDDLANHICLPAGVQDSWKLKDASGEPHQVRLTSFVRTDSANFSREALVSGVGIGLRSVWDVQDDIDAGRLTRVLEDFTGSGDDAIYAVYPSRDFMPTKVHVFIEYIGEIYAADPVLQAR